MRDRNTITAIIDRHRPDLANLESLYKHFHANPELSSLEKETSEKICSRLSRIRDYEVKTRIGGYGIAAILRNGDGPTVLLRADMDALPLEERTELPYASKKRMEDDEGYIHPVMHACGHDFHITNLLGAAELMHSARDDWSGTLVCIFQPAEEKGGGAQPMVDDGLYDKERHNVPIPDVVLGAHVTPIKAGTVGTRPGMFASASDSFKVTLHGKGGHGSQPHLSTDPIIMMAYIITRLQGIVSRELAMSEQAVVTVGAVRAGGADNVIPDRAMMKVNARSIDQGVRKRVIAAIERIIRTEAEASGATENPEIVTTTAYPVTYNDEKLTEAISETFSAHFGEKNHERLDEPLHGSEDFSNLARAINKPSTYWVYGGTDPDLYDKKKREGKLNDLPANHSPFFAPVIEPTIKTGVDSYAVAALTWLKKPQKKKTITIV